MRPAYLTGERVYLRAMVERDKEVAAAWFPSPFPVNASRADAWFKEHLAEAWGFTTPHYLAIALVEDDAVVGGVILQNRSRRAGTLQITMAPWRADADLLRAEALRLLVRWVRDDLEYMTLTVPVAVDELATIAVAEELGLVVAARLRERLARPGGRLDQIVYQAVNAPWTAADA